MDREGRFQNLLAQRLFLQITTVPGASDWPLGTGIRTAKPGLTRSVLPKELEAAEAQRIPLASSDAPTPTPEREEANPLHQAALEEPRAWWPWGEHGHSHMAWEGSQMCQRLCLASACLESWPSCGGTIQKPAGQSRDPANPNWQRNKR